METLKTISETITALLGVVSIFLFGYTLILGFAHRAGKAKWLEWRKQQRKLEGKPNIELLSMSNKTEFPWKDPSLFQNALTSLTVVIYAFLTVAITLFWIYAFTGITPSNESIVVALILPIGTIGMGILPGQINYIIRQHNLSKSSFLSINIISFVSAALAVSMLIIKIYLLKSGELAFYSQITLFLIATTNLSYVYGISDGLKEADIETRFPLVEVMTNKDKTLKQLRLYEKTDLDYRFIDEEGSEHIFPSAIVMEIRHTLKKEVKKTEFPSAQSARPNKG